MQDGLPQGDPRLQGTLSFTSLPSVSPSGNHNTSLAVPSFKRIKI